MPSSSTANTILPRRVIMVRTPASTPHIHCRSRCGSRRASCMGTMRRTSSRQASNRWPLK
ncbi:Uncharacterised protein [Bordetella pertussis]|nr:Uncharacterised protein [Bordetella pertussis]